MKRYLLGARIVDGTGRPPVENGGLAMENGRIVAVGRVGDFNPEPEAEVVDVTGKTLVPGLVNCHGHLAWDAVHNLKDQSVNDSPGIAAFKCARAMALCLEAGVTTFRDLGVHVTGTWAKQAQAMGLVRGPRVLTSGAAITMTGGHTYWCGVQADGEAEVRKAVREQFRLGADLIKVMASGGSGEPGEVADLPEFTFGELCAAAEEAHRANKTITAHATGREATRRVVEAGFDCIEHGAPFDDETIEMMVKRGVYLVTTFSALFVQGERGLEAGLPRSIVERRKRQMADHERMGALVRAVQAGVKVALGTDAGSPMVPHNMIAYEMQCMVRVGVCRNSMDAIVAATRTGAEVCRLQDRLGTLEPGKLADVVVIDGDPLVDLSAMERVELVYQEGKLVFSRAAAAMLE